MNLRQDDDHALTMLGMVRNFMKTHTADTAEGPAIPAMITALAALVSIQRQLHELALA